MIFQPGERVEFDGRPGTVVDRDCKLAIVLMDGDDRKLALVDSALTYTGRNVAHEHTVFYQGQVWHLRCLAAGEWFCFEKWRGRELKERKVGTVAECMRAFNTAAKKMEAKHGNA